VQSPRQAVPPSHPPPLELDAFVPELLDAVVPEVVEAPPVELVDPEPVDEDAALDAPPVALDVDRPPVLAALDPPDSTGNWSNFTAHVTSEATTRATPTAIVTNALRFMIDPSSTVTCAMVEPPPLFCLRVISGSYAAQLNERTARSPQKRSAPSVWPDRAHMPTSGSPWTSRGASTT
jgi:hypothetical protein